MTHLTIFRAKHGVVDPDELLKDREALIALKVTVSEQSPAVLYVSSYFSDTPTWLKYLGGAVETGDYKFTSSGSGAVLLLTRHAYLYAIVFGYGRNLLNMEAVEHRFGLHVTLNAVDPAKLRSIDHRRLNEVARHTREELSRAAGVSQFGVDVERDLLRAVTGTPTDSVYGTRLSGGDPLVVVGDIPLSRLHEFIDRYALLAGSKAYKANFPWVDNVFEVTDPRRRAALDDTLVKRLKRGKGEWWLAPPEIVDWTTVLGFRFLQRKSAEVFADMNIDDYFAQAGARRDLTAERLHQDRVFCVDADDGPSKRSWAVHRCLVGELRLKEETFVISEGKWYQVGESFAAQLETFLAGIDRPALTLPKCGARVSEGDYNRYVAKKQSSISCLDQDLVSVPGQGKVEVCDLYSSSRILVHVKHQGSSSVMSHLFSQGVVSAQLLAADDAFRQAFHGKLPTSHQWGDPTQKIAPGQFEVCFAIIARSGSSVNLPFFSKVNLRTAVRTIRGLNMKVSRIDIPR